MMTEVRGRVEARADEADDLLPSLSDYLSHWACVQPDQIAVAFTDYDVDRDGIRRELTWRELDERVSAVAARVSELSAPGDRVAVLVGPGDEYTVAFLGAVRAGRIAVPLFPPGLMGGNDRVGLVVRDCAATVLLSTSGSRDVVEEFRQTLPEAERPELVLVDELVGERATRLARIYEAPELGAHDIAYLQYTSGSTRTPAGVIISNRNVVINARQLIDHHTMPPQISAVSWLPLFHDMGLVLGIACPVVYGGLSVLFDPIAFVQRPLRWLQHLSQSPSPFTGAPNFAYEYTAKRVKDKDFEGLSLGHMGQFGNAAEPVQASTLEAFHERFASVGLRRSHLLPMYGLAEATVFASSPYTEEVATVLEVDADELGHGRAVPAGEGSRVSSLVGIGRPGFQEMRIVSAEEDGGPGTTCAEGIVGEIWLRGPNVSRGYWGNEEATRATFRNELIDDPTPELGGWLRTGDLGFERDGQFFITGRIKDLIIIDGRNVYPHDIERTVEAAHPAIGPHRTAAFSIPGDKGERVVIVSEQYRLAEDAADQIPEIATAVKRAVLAEHNVAVHDFVLAQQFSVPRTSSAKIQRRATRQAYLEERLPRVGD